MNVFIFNAHAEPPQGQATRHFDLAKVMVARGHQVTIIAGSFSHHSLTQVPEVQAKEWDAIGGQGTGVIVGWQDGVKFVFVPITGYQSGDFNRLRSWWQYYWRALAWARGSTLDRPDVIVGVTAHMAAALAAKTIAAEWDVPFVYEVTDIWPRMPIESGAMSKYNPLAWWLSIMDAEIAKAARAIVGYWPRMDKHYARVAPDVPCTFIPHPVDLARYNVQASPSTNGKFRVVYLGSVSAYYDIDPALDAMKRIDGVNAPMKAELLIVGNGADRNRLMHRVVNEHIPRVTFMDSIPKTKVPELLALADALVFTMKPMAIHKEFRLSGNKISDYCAAGKPVLLNTDAILYPDEIYKAAFGTNASTLGSTILYLMGLPQKERDAIGAKTRQIAEEHYDVRKVAGQYLAVLEGVV